jgi:hypothetical protein
MVPPLRAFPEGLRAACPAGSTLPSDGATAVGAEVGAPDHVEQVPAAELEAGPSEAREAEDAVPARFERSDTASDCLDRGVSNRRLSVMR